MTLLDYYYEGNDDRSEGERARDEAFERRRWSRAALVRRMQRAFIRHLLDHGPNSTDRLRELVAIPTGTDPRIVGYVARSLSSDLGITHRVWSTKTARKVAHARHLEVWAVIDSEKARVWLDTHPEFTG
ncbi:hypothetical protein R5W23_000118 [Gemmata sp. JC673]|uniref:Uncharacterized protein n=1 Tax=Gemmata algarum TaxID=2975278 RepID=A0ABU5EV38_9BACT|nr:hypothetical protein [Gemmata algarum]MDY3557591.1 hypothetical protein [Gemmata algarum]